MKQWCKLHIRIGLVLMMLMVLPSCSFVHKDERNQFDDEILIDLPWENGGKQPDEYTWEEFEALNGMEQEAFVESFDSAEEFETWESDAKKVVLNTEDYCPWEKGGKQPEEYTWKEFEALSGVEQEAFVESFESAAMFNEWERNAKIEE